MRLSLRATLAAGLVAAIAFPLFASALTLPAAPAPKPLSPSAAAALVQYVATTVVGCTALSGTLSRGATGAPVKALQVFLVGQGLLTADSASGFFGPLTMAAVQKFQIQKGLVSSGTPATTGFGAVGPKTRAAIAATCASAASTAKARDFQDLTAHITAKLSNPSCPLVELPIGKSCSGTWKEVKDANQCTASWDCVNK